MFTLLETPSFHHSMLAFDMVHPCLAFILLLFSMKLPYTYGRDPQHESPTCIGGGKAVAVELVDQAVAVTDIEVAAAL